MMMGGEQRRLLRFRDVNDEGLLIFRRSRENYRNKTEDEEE